MRPTPSEHRRSLTTGTCAWSWPPGGCSPPRTCCRCLPNGGSCCARADLPSCREGPRTSQPETLAALCDILECGPESDRARPWRLGTRAEARRRGRRLEVGWAAAPPCPGGAGAKAQMSQPRSCPAGHGLGPGPPGRPCPACRRQMVAARVAEADPGLSAEQISGAVEATVTGPAVLRDLAAALADGPGHCGQGRPSWSAASWPSCGRGARNCPRPAAPPAGAPAGRWSARGQGGLPSLPQLRAGRSVCRLRRAPSRHIPWP